jgi:putative metallohydrolase (TIGR04338 family)
MARDFQRQRVFDAEDACPPGQVFWTLAGMSAFVERVTRSRWWRSRVPSGYWHLTLDSYTPRSTSEQEVYVDRRRRKIVVPLDPKTGVIIGVAEEDLLHELAHFLTKRLGHGPEFVRSLIDLTRKFHSKPTRATALSGKLVDNGVAVKRKTK